MKKVLLDLKELKGMNDLTQGPIMPTLMKLTLPIIATNFISTTYTRRYDLGWKIRKWSCCRDWHGEFFH